MRTAPAAASQPGPLPLQVARVYDVLDQPADPAEFRVLVDRLWPRGVRKDRLEGVRWAKEAAPSDHLRRALHAGEVSGSGFAGRYRRELEASGAAADLLNDARNAGAEALTLLIAGRDVEGSHAHVLLGALRDVAEDAGTAR